MSGSHVVEIKDVEIKDWAPTLFGFATKDEAMAYGRRLLSEWTLADEFRVVGSPLAPTSKLVDGKVVNLGAQK